jgi:hypothetical protein
MSNGMIYMQWYDISTDDHTQKKNARSLHEGNLLQEHCCNSTAIIEYIEGATPYSKMSTKA